MMIIDDPPLVVCRWSRKFSQVREARKLLADGMANVGAREAHFGDPHPLKGQLGAGHAGPMATAH